MLRRVVQSGLDHLRLACLAWDGSHSLVLTRCHFQLTHLLAESRLTNREYERGMSLSQFFRISILLSLLVKSGTKVSSSATSNVYLCEAIFAWSALVRISSSTISSYWVHKAH